MRLRNLNNDTKKSEPTVFAQISVSILRFVYYVCCEAFQGSQHRIVSCRTVVLMYIWNVFKICNELNSKSMYLSHCF